MYHKIILSFVLIGIFTSCNSSKTIQSHNEDEIYYVYEEGKKVGTLGITDIKKCTDCYFFDNLTINNKQIAVIIPVRLLGKNTGTYAEPTLSIKKISTNMNTLIDVELHATHLDKYKLYIANNEEEIIIEKSIHYLHDSYMKEIGKNDFVSTRALKICVDTANYKVKDTLDLRTHPIFNSTMSNCKYCDYEDSDFENCKKMIN